MATSRNYRFCGGTRAIRKAGLPLGALGGFDKTPAIERWRTEHSSGGGSAPMQTAAEQGDPLGRRRAIRFDDESRSTAD